MLVLVQQLPLAVAALDKIVQSDLKSWDAVVVVDVVVAVAAVVVVAFVLVLEKTFALVQKMGWDYIVQSDLEA